MIPIGSITTGATVLSGLLSPLASTSQLEEAVESGSAELSTASESSSSTTTGATAALRSILASYDVTDITPRQFSAMLAELRDSGAMSDEELSELGQILVDLDAENVDPDESLDLVQFYSDRLEDLQEQLGDTEAEDQTASGVASSLAAAESRLSWVTKFAVMHSAPDAVGMDLLT